MDARGGEDCGPSSHTPPGGSNVSVNKPTTQGFRRPVANNKNTAIIKPGDVELCTETPLTSDCIY